MKYRIPFDLLCSVFLILLLPFGQVWGEKTQARNKPAEIHENSVLMPGPEGKDLILDLQGNTDKGKLVFERYCVYCHGSHGKGDGLAAIGLTPSPADLSQTFSKKNPWNKKEKQRLFDIITYGRKGSHQIRMPAWGPVLSKQERMDVLEYVRSIFDR